MDLTEPILSRFDILTVIRDEVQEDIDDQLATFVINSHMKSHPMCKMSDDFPDKNEEIKQQLAENMLENEILTQMENNVTPLNQEFLRKYIIYAKRYCHPRLNECDSDKVTNFYKDIRRESMTVGGH